MGTCKSPITTVSSEKQLVERFGAPTSSESADSFFPAAGFLKYGSTLRVVRAAATGIASAGNSAAVSNLYNNDQYEGATFGSNDWVARCPGALGNSLAVITCVPGTTPGTDFNLTAWNVCSI